MKDVQNTQDCRNVDIQKVGITDIDLPLRIQRKNKSDLVVSGVARAAVSLPRNYKGTHMSRFVEVFNEWREKDMLGVDIKGCLEKIIKKLHAQSGELKFKFKYFINKKAPVSRLSAPMSYDCSFEGRIDESGNYKFILGAKVPVTTLCPCSKEISEYGAHNQRAIISVKISYDDLGKQIVLDIWDTAGQEKYKSLTKFFYKDAQVCILVYDITLKQSFDNLKDYWVAQIKENADKNLILGVAGNKSDLYEEEAVNEKEAREFAASIGAIFALTSALNSSGISELFLNVGHKYLDPNFQQKLEVEKKQQKEDAGKNITLEKNEVTNVKKKKKSGGFC